MRAAYAIEDCVLAACDFRTHIDFCLIRIGENLIRTCGPRTSYRLVFPNYDVKNRASQNFLANPDTNCSGVPASFGIFFRSAIISRKYRCDVRVVEMRQPSRLPTLAFLPFWKWWSKPSYSTTMRAIPLLVEKVMRKSSGANIMIAHQRMIFQTIPYRSVSDL
jgi:hypothetical protein